MPTAPPTTLKLHLSTDFLTDLTGSPDGNYHNAPADKTNQGGVWAYIFVNKPPAGQSNWTPLVENGVIDPTLTKVGSDYQVSIDLTTTTSPQVSGGVAYLIVQSEDPTGHHDLTSSTYIGTTEGNIQPNVAAWNYGYAAFEYTLDGAAGDQGDITYIPGFGPHLAVEVNGLTRGLSVDSSDFLTDLKSPTGAQFTYPQGPPQGPTTHPFSNLDGKVSFAVSPSNGTFGSQYFSPSDWSNYLTYVAGQPKIVFSGTFTGSNDASQVWHNALYYSYSLSQVTVVSDPGTPYFLFSPNSASETQGYMLIKQSDVLANLYAPGQGSALAKLYQTAVFQSAGVFDDQQSKIYDIPGTVPPGSSQPADEFNVSANTPWGNSFTQFFTGFTAGYWGTVANQANPVNQGGGTAANWAGTLDLNTNLDWNSAYAFDKNRANPVPQSSGQDIQHNDQYSFQYYTHANTYASAFSDALANGLNPGPQISLATGPGVNQNVSQIDLIAYGRDEIDGKYTHPVGANFVAAPTGSDYLIPTAVTTTGPFLNINGSDAQATVLSKLRADATLYLGIYKGQDSSHHAQFDYVPLASGTNIYQNFTISRSHGNWSASGAGANQSNFININNLPTAASVQAGDVYWYQLVVANKMLQNPPVPVSGEYWKVFDIYATIDARGQIVPYNPPTVGSANSPTAAIDGNAIINTVATQLTVGLQPDLSLPVGLLDYGFSSSIVKMLAAPVAGHWISASDFEPVAGQNGTGVDTSHGYQQIKNPVSGQFYDNPAPSITITTQPDLAFGWTGSNNIAYDPSTGGTYAPTHPVFQTSAPFNNIVPGQVSEYTNKIVPGHVAKVSFYSDPGLQHEVGTAVTGVADLDGQWSTDSGTLGNGTFYAVMQEMLADGVTPFAGGPQSAALTINVNLPTLSFQNTGGNFLQLDPGGTGASGNWIKLHVDGSSLPNGTLLAYATDGSGNMLDRDGHITTDIGTAVLARIGMVRFDDGTAMGQGDQSVYLPVGDQLHFAIQTGDNLIEQLPGVQTSGSGSLDVHVSGGFGTLDLSATVNNTLSSDDSLGTSQRTTDKAWFYLTNGSTMHVDLKGSSYDYNTVHFVRFDVDPGTGAMSVGGVAYGNTDAFRAAVQAHWDPNLSLGGGRGSYQTGADWTITQGTGYYAPVLANEKGNIFVVGNANVDGQEHIRIYGSTMVGFEDRVGGDFDYNDAVLKISHT